MRDISCNLSDCFLCKTCIPEWKELVAVRKTTRLIKKGQLVFREGEAVNGIFFLNSGSVKVYKKWGMDKELILRFAVAGDILGHRGLGGEAVYPISATALEDCRVCFITNAFLETTLKANHDLTYELMHFYATELQKAEKRMRNLAHMEVKGRIAEALMQIATLFGVDKDQFIAASITRQDIASYAGTTYETVFKFFTELTDKKIIATNGKRIRIDKPDVLKMFISTAS
jgi:CRP-like cAMP-binding protein